MKGLSNQELSAFCDQMYMALKSGTSSAECLSLLAQDKPEGEERQMLQGLEERIRSGKDLSRALGEDGNFPNYMWKMVRIGETTGSTDKVMKDLSDYYIRQESISNAIRGAFTYPLLMCVVMAVVIGVLLVKVMPVFEQVFRQLGMSMSGFSRGALLLGQGLSRYAAWIIGILALVTVLFVAAMRSEGGRNKLKGIGRKIPAVGSIFHSQAACHFAGVLGLALASGLTEEEGFSMAEQLNEDRVFGSRIMEAKRSMAAGKSLADAMTGAGMYSGLHGQAITIAGRTGFLDERLIDISDEMADEVDNKTAKFISRLEPTLVVLLSLVIGTVLLSVMVPLLGILSGL